MVVKNSCGKTGRTRANAADAQGVQANCLARAKSLSRSNWKLDCTTDGVKGAPPNAVWSASKEVIAHKSLSLFLLRRGSVSTIDCRRMASQIGNKE